MSGPAVAGYSKHFFTFHDTHSESGTDPILSDRMLANVIQ